MLGITGIGLARRLKADPATRAIPVILLGAAACRAAATAAGCDAFVAAGSDATELVAVARAGLTPARGRGTT
jgi:CheY-like chemotaxis protein